jgi:hypothetical protein
MQTQIDDGTSRIVLMNRDPEVGFAYWKVSQSLVLSASTLVGGGIAYLRLVDCRTGRISASYETNAESGRYYLRFPHPDRAYRAELVLVGGTRTALLVRSNRVRVPRDFRQSPAAPTFAGATVRRGALADRSSLFAQARPGITANARAIRTLGGRVRAQSVAGRRIRFGAGSEPRHITFGSELRWLGVAGSEVRLFGFGSEQRLIKLGARRFVIAAETTFGFLLVKRQQRNTNDSTGAAPGLARIVPESAPTVSPLTAPSSVEYSIVSAGGNAATGANVGDSLGTATDLAKALGAAIALGAKWIQADLPSVDQLATEMGEEAAKQYLTDTSIVLVDAQLLGGLLAVTASSAGLIFTIMFSPAQIAPEPSQQTEPNQSSNSTGQNQDSPDDGQTGFVFTEDDLRDVAGQVAATTPEMVFSDDEVAAALASDPTQGMVFSGEEVEEMTDSDEADDANAQSGESPLYDQETGEPYSPFEGNLFQPIDGGSLYDYEQEYLQPYDDEDHGDDIDIEQSVSDGINDSIGPENQQEAAGDPFGGGGCFPKDVFILMDDGSAKQIQDVRQGDYVQAISEREIEGVRPSLRRAVVQAAHRRVGDQPLRLIAAIPCTSEQPWAIRVQNEYFFVTSQMIAERGDSDSLLLSVDEGLGRWIRPAILMDCSASRADVVFNLSTSLRTYFVARSPVGPWFLVHNKIDAKAGNVLIEIY